MEKILGASWKTAVAGILAGVGILATQFGYLLDSDPNTVLDWKVCVGALGVMGIGWFARDNNVTSEQAKANP